MHERRMPMSTKIFNGYRRKTESLDDLQKFLNVFKEKARRLHQKAYKKAFIDYVVGIIDERAAGLENPTDDKSNVPYWIAFQNIQDQYEKTKMPNARRGLLYDFECSLSIFLEGEYAYFLLFAEDPKFTSLFSRQKGVHRYDYWDNTDRPNNISMMNWLERGDTWDRVLGPAGVPAERNMIMEVVGVYANAAPEYANGSLLKIKDILKNLPSFDDRVKRMADRTVFKHKKDTEKTISKLLAWLKTDEYNELVKLEQVELAKKLKHTLEEEDIY